jgi:hypothetical protein
MAWIEMREDREMRKAAFVINGNPVEGYWHETPVFPGFMHEGRRGWMVVEKVFDGTFNPGEGERDGYFCTMRPATAGEVAAHTAPQPVPTEAEMEAAWQRLQDLG